MILQSKKTSFLILGILVVFNLIAWGIVYEVSRPQQLEVIFLDVGQGDAMLIKTPEGHRILIDGGPDAGILEKLSQKIPFWDKEIDLVILTHPHHDHLNGLIDVIGSYNVGTILWTGVVSDTASFRRWQEMIAHSNVRIAQPGQRIRGRTFYLDILYPFDSFVGETVANLNLTSIVARLVSAQGSFLFMGDAYVANEKKLIEMKDYCIQEEAKDLVVCRVMILDSDVLKVGHHGSRTSTSEDFLQKVSPSIAIISLGKDNRYGHPHQEVLEILKNYGTRVLRTDIEGDIRIVK